MGISENNEWEYDGIWDLSYLFTLGGWWFWNMNYIFYILGIS